jgi:hypothetical protein
MPVILATQEAQRSGGLQFEANPDKYIAPETLSQGKRKPNQKPVTKIGLVEWPKVKALSSYSSTRGKKKTE